MEFIWFWTFWHWSREGFRSGTLLRGPLHGIAGHWDEWFRHEASDQELRAIASVDRDERLQRELVVWLARHWARQAEWRGERPPVRFVLGQLAQLPPFNTWAPFEKYREGYGSPGISAIVLAEGSQGESTDVRSVEAIALPADPDAPLVVSEGFEADSADLTTARQAALSVLGGRGLALLVIQWIMGGRRPYPGWLAATLAVGWLITGALIVFLLVGPEPGRRLLPLTAVLAVLWTGLAITAAVTAGVVGLRVLRVGRRLRDRLQASQVWIRMNGGLTLRGGSAGLPFCLNALLAVYQADRSAASGSWLWARVFRKLRSEADAWTATGVVTADAAVAPVTLEPKIRAGLVRPEIRHILTPRQSGATSQDVARVAGTLRPVTEASRDAPPPAFGRRLGFAAEERRLRGHRCRNVAQSLMAIADLTTRRQMAVNVFAVIVSVVMILALPDLMSILRPPRAPVVIGPASTSPYHLWVSLDTRRPEDFSVVLESDFWSNRRAEVTARGGINGSVRAELRLRRRARDLARDANDGTVWIERRRRFLSREFAAGERVGRYSLSYLSRLGQP